MQAKKIVAPLLKMRMKMQTINIKFLISNQLTPKNRLEVLLCPTNIQI